MNAELAAAPAPTEPPAGEPTEADVLDRLNRALSPESLAAAGWNADSQTLASPPDHPLLSRGICVVPACEARAASRNLCASCYRRWEISDLAIEEFLARPRGAYRKGQEVLCLVSGCPRVRKRSATGLCINHHTQHQRSYRHLDVTAFVVHPKTRPQRDLGLCQVEVCTRSRDTTSAIFCHAHGRQWAQHRKKHPQASRKDWARWAWPIAAGHEVVLRGLPPRVIAELLLGIQHRAILPGMVERGRGHVVNVGSAAGTYPYPGGNVYGATKAFVHQFSQNLRSDLHGTGVRVTCVEPGMCGGTEFSTVRFGGDRERAQALYAGMRPLGPADIAEAVSWAAGLPAHVNINVIELMPVAQSFAAFQVHRSPAPPA